MGVVGEHSAEIDGVTYTTKTFPATEALQLLWRIARLLDGNVVGQALLAMLSEPATADDREKSAAEEAWGSAVSEFLTNPVHLASMILGAAHQVSPEEGAAIARDVLRYVTTDKVKIGDTHVSGSVAKNFDTHFQGRLLHLAKVWWWAVRLGFAGP